jgi:hypothetical protein
MGFAETPEALILVLIFLIEFAASRLPSLLPAFFALTGRDGVAGRTSGFGQASLFAFWICGSTGDGGHFTCCGLVIK